MSLATVFKSFFYVFITLLVNVLVILNVQASQTPKTEMGKILRNIDISNVSAEDLKVIQSELLLHGVIVIKGKPVSPEVLFKFSQRLGRVPTLPKGLAFYNQVEGLEAVTRVTNLAKDGSIIKGHKAAEYWHQDGDFRSGSDSLMMNILHAHLVPKKGGETGFLDGQRVLKVIPKWLFDFFEQTNFYVVPSDIPDFDKKESSNLPRVTHRCIRIHEISNTKSLYLSMPDVVQLNNIPKDLSEELLNYTMKYLANNENTYIHHWEPGDTLVWDNTLVFHRGMGNYENEKRLLYRAQAFWK